MEDVMTSTQAKKLIGLMESLVQVVEQESTPEVMTPQQAAERWGMNKNVIYRLCSTGQIKAFKVGTQWRIPLRENEEVSYAKK